jgi:hypothetical protein
LSSRTDGGRGLRPHYLVYFLLVDLLDFPHSGAGEKVAWSVPIEYEGRLYTIEHRKFGLGIFEPQHDPNAHSSGPTTEQGECDSSEICQLLNRAIDAASPYFEWRAQREAKGAKLNVVNNSRSLLDRLEYFFGDAVRLRQESGRHQAEKLYTMARELGERANWSAQAAIEAFFSWSEHVFIHFAILLGKVTTGEQVRDLATADWKTKFKAVFDLSDPSVKAHYDVLLELRNQIRNFLAHGSFGKRGEAFHFHSGAGAVPLLITQREDHPFQIYGSAPFAEFNALANVESFLDWLWSSSLAPAKLYLDSDLPMILTYASDGTYAKAMRSNSAMEGFVEGLAHQWSNAANMDW